MLIMVAGRIGGVVGPLPYDMEECMRRRQECEEEVYKKFATPQRLIDGKVWSARDIQFRCVEAAERPQRDVK
ncbi:MAG: hypothetical protein ACR650_09825 [Methylocystis sp.]